MNLSAKLRANTQKIAQATLLTAAFFCASQGFAQSSADDRWYQVEIIAFSQTLTALDTSESWPNSIALAYPPGTVTLNSSESGNQDSTDFQSEISSTSSTLQEPNSSFSHNGENSPSNLTETTANIGNDISVIHSAEAPNNSANPYIKNLFKTVPEEELNLKEEKKRLEQNNRYRVLRHVAWRQPIGERTDAKAVVLTGGDKYDNHFELEGTVSLSAARYLHIQTNLWLTQFYPNLGDQTVATIWPSLPEIPKSSGINNSGTDINRQSGAINFGSNSDNSAISFNSQKSTNSFSQFSDQSFSLTNFKPQRKSYSVDQIVLLSETRKMRSNELHYIDHPTMGLLVKVTPWNPVNNGI
ncbi:CsiV family protein [Sessilibacter sp. MAH4]